MKIKLLLVLCLMLFSISLFSIFEEELNNIPPDANPIPIRDYRDFYSGTLQLGDPSDWCTYLALENDDIYWRVDLMANGLMVGNLYTPDLVLIHTLTFQGELFMFVAPVTGMYFLQVLPIVPLGAPEPYYFSVENGTSPTLPVTLSSFTAQQSGAFVGIQWTTQSETDMLGYNILRSTGTDMNAAVKANDLMIPATNQSTQHNYSWEDNEVEANTTYNYWLEALDLDGSSNYFGYVSVMVSGSPGGGDAPPMQNHARLLDAYPNPFSTSTTLKIDLGKQAQTKLEIFNLRGEKVATICDATLGEGIHSFQWQGRDQHGRTLANGVYLMRMTTPMGKSYKN